MSSPRRGDPITYCGKPDGRIVARVENNLCWCRYPDGDVLPFIWRFGDGALNTLHDWPTKSTE
jgi:hypothetical protein